MIKDTTTEEKKNTHTWSLKALKSAIKKEAGFEHKKRWIKRNVWQGWEDFLSWVPLLSLSSCLSSSLIRRISKINSGPCVNCFQILPLVGLFCPLTRFPHKHLLTVAGSVFTCSMRWIPLESTIVQSSTCVYRIILERKVWEHGLPEFELISIPSVNHQSQFIACSSVFLFTFGSWLINCFLVSISSLVVAYQESLIECTNKTLQ